MKLAIIICVFLSVLCSGVKGSEPVSVSVYYETLCPDSITFINSELHSIYKDFGERLIELELVPFGFAKEYVINGSRSFICQHGQKECYGNKVHGCVVNSEPIATSEDFVHCSENAVSPASTDYLKQCAEQNHINWTAIDSCLSSGRADEIMSKNGEKTNKIHPSFIPTVVFNNVFNEADSTQSMNDFRGVVCKYLDNKPEQCNSSDTFKGINIINVLVV